MDLNKKSFGLLLIGFSIILIVVLGFVKANVDRQGAFLCEAVAANPDMEMSECPAHQSNTSWLIVVAFGIAFLVLGIGSYMAFMPQKAEKQTKKVDTSKLEKEEKKVYDLLKENDGSMYQSDIKKETGLSKVKTTRVLDKLENKKILERKRRGMTNLVVLK